MSGPDLLVILPFRLASSRIKKKVLAPIGSKTLVEHTLSKVLGIFKSNPRVLVLAAVDSEAVKKLLEKKFQNLEVIMTPAELASGTDRVFAAAQDFVSRNIQWAGQIKGIINVQGDIPFVGREGLERISNFFLESTCEELRKTGMATLAQSWPMGQKSDQKFSDPSAVKVITNREGLAIYFSRWPIPHSRIPVSKKVRPLAALHIGVYGYTRDVLTRICAQKPTDLELGESLEQLRAQWLGIPILVIPTEPGKRESFRGIDTPKDLVWARRFLR